MDFVGESFLDLDVEAVGRLSDDDRFAVERSLEVDREIPKCYAFGVVKDERIDEPVEAKRRPLTVNDEPSDVFQQEDDLLQTRVVVADEVELINREVRKEVVRPLGKNKPRRAPLATSIKGISNRERIVLSVAGPGPELRDVDLGTVGLSNDRHGKSRDHDDKAVMREKTVHES